MRLKFWCRYCGYKTWQVCLPDIQSLIGLYWRCERCHRGTERSASQAWTGERS